MAIAAQLMGQGKARLRAFTLRNIVEDIRLFLTWSYNVQGDGSYKWERVLPFTSLLNGYRLVPNPVQWDVKGTTLRRSVFAAAPATEFGFKSIRRTKNLRTNAGGDWLARALGGDSSVGDAGTSTATSATSLTDTGKTWTVNQWAGHVVGVAGTVYGVILSNTATALTLDKWYTPATPGGAAAGTPSATSAYQIFPGQQPALWLAVSNDAVAPAAADTTLAAEITTNGFARKLAAFTHTPVAGGPTQQGTVYSLAATFSATGTQAAQKGGIFNASTGGIMPFENTFSPTISAGNGDQATITWQVTTT